jgi:hypothetical protein
LHIHLEQNLFIAVNAREHPLSEVQPGVKCVSVVEHRDSFPNHDLVEKEKQPADVRGNSPPLRVGPIASSLRAGEEDLAVAQDHRIDDYVAWVDLLPVRFAADDERPGPTLTHPQCRNVHRVVSTVRLAPTANHIPTTPQSCQVTDEFLAETSKARIWPGSKALALREGIVSPRDLYSDSVSLGSATHFPRAVRGGDRRWRDARRDGEARHSSRHSRRVAASPIRGCVLPYATGDMDSSRLPSGSRKYMLMLCPSTPAGRRAWG